MRHLWMMVSVFITAFIFIGCATTSTSQEKPADVISSESATLEPSVPEKRVQEVYWKLIGVEGKAVIEDPHAREAYMILRLEDHRLQGFGGCNILMGSYVLDETAHKVKFSSVASTMMACPRLHDESAFLKALENVESYSIEEGVLLLQKEGKTVITFEAVYQP